MESVTLPRFTFEPFRYTPLPTKTSIRLISMVKTAKENTEFSLDGIPLMQCALHTVDLDDDPSYRALSYTWGNPGVLSEIPPSPDRDSYSHKHKWPIALNGRLLFVQRNLYEALTQLGVGKDIDARSAPFDKTKLIEYAERGEAALVEYCILQGASLQSQDKFGETALHYAAENGHIDVVRMLLDAGAQRDVLDNAGRTPLECCLQRRRGQFVEVAELLTDSPKPSQAPSGLGYFGSRLWIDAICIGQENIQERNSQVSMMADIYTKARSVLVWTGMEHEFRRGSALDLSNSLKTTFSKMLNRSYFQRAWIVQEMSLARHIFMLSGPLAVEWNNPLGRMNNLLRPKMKVDLDISMNPAYVLAELQDYYRSPEGKRGCPLDFHFLLRAAWNFKASDPRDKIFSLLGLASATQPVIAVDYGRPTGDLFLDIGRRLAEGRWDSRESGQIPGMLPELEPLEGLYYHQAPACFLRCRSPGSQACDSCARPEGLPSWAPNFSWPLRARRLVHATFEAATAQSLRVYPSPQAILKPDACMIDRISMIGNGDIHCPHTWLDLVRHLQGEHLVEYMWNTMHMGGVDFGQGDLDAFRVGFRRYLARGLCPDPHVIYHERGLDNGNDKFEWKRTVLSDTEREKYLALVRRLRADDGFGCLPTDAELATMARPRDQNAVAGPSSVDMAFAYWRRLTYTSRSPFLSEEGSMGLGSEIAEVGDEIWLLAGARTPFIMRKSIDGSGRYRMVGEAYVHGVMYGEAIEKDNLDFHPVEIE